MTQDLTAAVERVRALCDQWDRYSLPDNVCVTDEDVADLRALLSAVTSVEAERVRCAGIVTDAMKEASMAGSSDSPDRFKHNVAWAYLHDVLRKIDPPLPPPPAAK